MKTGIGHDTAASAIIGVAGGLLLQPILTDVIPGIGLLLRVVLFFICALGAPVGLALAVGILPRFARFFRFALVGALNTAVDLGILNALIIVFGQRTFYLFPIYATIGFLAATLNSYFWNKHWAFADRPARGGSAVAWFYIVSVGSFFVNVGIATGLVHAGVPPHLTLVLWENIAKAIGIAASLVTNFIGYRLLVFRERRQPVA